MVTLRKLCEALELFAGAALLSQACPHCGRHPPGQAAHAVHRVSWRGRSADSVPRRRGWLHGPARERL